jgi:UDP-N-acetylglucosamine transferase subunit ALG13
MKKIKIFVEVGSHKMSFIRLFKEVDRLIETGLNCEVYAQKGYTKYNSNSFESKEFLSEQELIKKIRWADVIVAHAGAGNIISVLTNKKPLVLVPRRKEFNEHTDNHQTELAKILEKEKKCIAVYDIKELKKGIIDALKIKAKIRTEKSLLEKEIEKFIKKMEMNT